MDLEDTCNIGLVHVLGSHGDHYGHMSSHWRQNSPAYKPPVAEELSLTLSLCSDGLNQPQLKKVDVKKVAEEQVQSSPHSIVSSYSNTSNRENFAVAIKRERDIGGDDGRVERISSQASDEEEEASARKKLRLTKEQSALLEESFKEHTTLNPKQKQALAKQLNLRPRQVEVWFQNRRARTKLKQTEVDCEFLKRCCESLTDENKRLQRELLDLKAMKFSSPFYMQLSAATLTMCPSCERIGASPVAEAAASTVRENPAKASFGLGTRPAHFYSHFATHSSAAC